MSIDSQRGQVRNADRPENLFPTTAAAMEENKENFFNCFNVQKHFRCFFMNTTRFWSILFSQVDANACIVMCAKRLLKKINRRQTSDHCQDGQVHTGETAPRVRASRPPENILHDLYTALLFESTPFQGSARCNRTRQRPGPDNDHTIWSFSGPEISGPNNDHLGSCCLVLKIF